MSPPIKQVSFGGGEISPSMYARTDIGRYESSLRTMRNYIAMRHGGATQRPGTMYVGTTQNGGNQVRLIPFIFNETGLGQSYVLEFGNLYIGFYQNGGVVTSGGNPYTIVSPYAQADLSTLQFAECADVVTIVHPNYPVYELRRLGATNWTIAQVTFGPSQAPPTGGSISGSSGGAIKQTYFVTAISSQGEESEVLTIMSGGSLQPATPTSPITLGWSGASGAVSYRIYYAPNQVGGFVGTSVTAGFIDTGVTPDYTNSNPVVAAIFNSAGNYPSTVGFAQQRRGFAATINNPIGFWFSQPGFFNNFTVSTIAKDSDAVIGSIAGEEVNAIQHLVELKFMLMLTAGAEIYVQGSGSGIVTPSAINASVQSQYGSAALRPLKTGDVLIFNQALGSFIRDFAFDFAIDGYRGNDVSIFASHLFEGYILVDWAYQKVPDSIIWAVRSDGKLLSCTYVREQQMLAWAQHDLQGGIAENVCAIPENGEYGVYVSIKRVINGSTVRYMERLSSRIWQGPAAAVAAGTANSLGDPIDSTYLDCFSSYDGRNAGATTMTLTASGAFTSDDTAYRQLLTLTSSVSYFTAGMVGDQIFLQDADFVSSQGASGNQVKCTIQSYSSGTVVTVTPSGTVPVEFQAVAITNWSHAVDSLSGLGYLAGEQVSIWADRFVVGSPNNSSIQTKYTIPASGIITLDKAYAVIYVGLPMTADLESLDVDSSWGETGMGKRKRAARINVHVYNTRNLFGGSENPDTNLNNTNDDPLFELEEFERGTTQGQWTEPPQLTTAQDYILTTAHFNMNGRIFIRNVDPVPCTLLAWSPQGEDTLPNAVGKRV